MPWFLHPQSPLVLKNINLFIQVGKTIAIVGGSGSGKTTLLKIRLRFDEATTGEISVNEYKLYDISPLNWRQNCGVVMQDGYIFAESINRNIATRGVDIDDRKLENAIKIANISTFINSLHSKGETKIGSTGVGVSGGQKQRLLIARAVYKPPHFIFFDEATSSLDTQNEKIIHDNLKDFFNNKTVVIIAHRLSKVKNADLIVALKEGGDRREGTLLLDSFKQSVIKG